MADGANVAGSPFFFVAVASNSCKCLCVPTAYVNLLLGHGVIACVDLLKERRRGSPAGAWIFLSNDPSMHDTCYFWS